MSIRLNPNRRLACRAVALLALTVTLVAASTRLQAQEESPEATGTCGGAVITLPFTDVPGSNIFFCAIASAYFSGLTNGTSATTYSPSASVPREQMAAFIARTQDSALRRGSRRAALNQWWTPQNQSALRVTNVGNAPQGVACDGADLWVANSSTVSRVRASDGMLLQTWTGATSSVDVVIAAGYVYVTARTNPGRIYRINPTQAPGAVTTFANTLGAEPIGITFDGLHLWTANRGDGPGTGSISRVHIGTGAVTTFTTSFNQPVGILFDGANVWVADLGDNILKKVNSSGAVIQTVSVGSPVSPVFDGTNIWVPNLSSNSVTVVRAATGAVLQTLTGNGLNVPNGAAFDGERILAVNFYGDSVSLWKAADLTPLGSVSMGTGTLPAGVCSDGLNFWITLFNTDQLARF